MDDWDFRTGFYSIRQYRKKILADISQVSTASAAFPVCPVGDRSCSFGNQEIIVRISSRLWPRATAFLAGELASQEFLRGPGPPLAQAPQRMGRERQRMAEKKSPPGPPV